MLCLRCNSVMNKKLYKNQMIDECLCCGGIFFDKGQFQKVLYNICNEDIVTLYKKYKIQEKEQKSNIVVGFCPRCNKNKMQHYIRKGIDLDICVDCGGIFFDKGQFQKLLKLQKPNLIKKILYKIGVIKNGIQK